MAAESHGDSYRLPSSYGAVFKSWRAENVIFWCGQILHSGYLHHSPTAGSGHLSLADLQILHREIHYIHPARCRWVGITVILSVVHIDKPEGLWHKLLNVWLCLFSAIGHNDLLYSDEGPTTTGNYSGAPSTKVRGNVRLSDRRQISKPQAGWGVCVDVFEKSGSLFG